MGATYVAKSFKLVLYLRSNDVKYSSSSVSGNDVRSVSGSSLSFCTAMAAYLNNPFAFAMGDLDGDVQLLSDEDVDMVSDGFPEDDEVVEVISSDGDEEEVDDQGEEGEQGEECV